MSVITFKARSKYLYIKLCGIPFRIKHGKLSRKMVEQLLAMRYKKKLKVIRQKKKIRVGFLVAEPAKWGYQSVYDAFATENRFEPVIMTTKLSFEHNNGTTNYKTMADCKDFFEQKGMRVESAYDEANKQYIPLNKMDVDIVFYEQPWELDQSQHPINVSKYAITCYSSYGFELMNYSGSYMENFHRWIDFFFTVSDATYAYIKDIAKNMSNVFIVGWPKLDVYPDIKPAKPSKPIIIYAPHHSFEENGLNLATFQYNGQFILDLAKKYADKFDWYFKPHPRLKHALIKNNIMTEQEANDYYMQWQKVGKICDSGDYFEMFQESSAMITDCCSFLGEYLPTEKPVFHLINTKAQFNDVANSFIGTYYQIYDNKQLVNEFERVLIDGDDHKRAMRKSKIPLLYDKNEKAGVKIYKKILDSLEYKDV